jgi:3-oxoacyl-[acyl-carrier-protein] synthase-1
MIERDPVAFFLGAGIHSGLGNGIHANLQALRRPPEPAPVHHNNLTAETLRIPYKLLANSSLANPEDRLGQVVHDVTEQALTEAGLTAQQRQNMGLFIGSSSFNIAVNEARFQYELAGMGPAVALRDPGVGNLADYLVETMGLRGADYSFNTACTASANALTAAVAQIQVGLIEYALVLGVELYNEVTAMGFHGLGLLSHSVMKPFDESRDGLVLGESVSALVIGRAPDDGAERFFLRGWANLSDNFSISTNSPDGSTVAAVMKQALDNAGISDREVDCLKVHGTASLSNDESEAAGMHRVFSRLPLLCALKPYIGHTMGACGLSELVLFYRALEAGFLVANPGISAVAGDLDVTLNQVCRAIAPGNFMLNYFGFGGNNTSLLISNKLQGQ